MSGFAINNRLEPAIRAALDTIVDPCSAAAGAPVGLVSLGLVRDIHTDERDDGAHVRLTLALTEPGCMMSPIFERESRDRLLALEGVTSVDVSIDYGYIWTPEDMAPEYRRKLTSFRERQRAHMRKVSAPE